MAVRSVYFNVLTGPGEPPEPAPARMWVKVSPAVPIEVDDDAVNFDIAREFDLTTGENTVGGMEDTWLSGPVTWLIEIWRWDKRSNRELVQRKLVQFPAGSGVVDYVDMIEVDTVELPEFGPSWAEQAHQWALQAEASAGDASNRIPLTQKGAASGVATLDGSTQVPAAQLNNAVKTSTVTTSRLKTNLLTLSAAAPKKWGA